ncbi:MAG TPA: glycosyltransferase, partial [bacterium]|nr:glycosyltransferase [bacterium]
MTTNTLTRNALPECTLGRAGHDLFSSRKDLTVIMVPFERFSPFAKAVDDLYKTMDVPFNLIVIEGNAPESVRASLEKCQRKHKNITIIYSNHQTSIGAAINLAVPHLKTKYAFIIDNDVRIPRGAMSSLLRGALENQ